MKQMNSQTSKSETERYLYGEMSDTEREQLEEKFFDDDEFFYSVVGLENELVDRYANGKLSGAELERFERALENAPERRAKIANAVALQAFIAEEKPQTESIVAAVQTRQTFGQRLAKLFSIQTPAVGYAMAGLFILFAVSIVFLLLDNRRKADELAQLQNERQTVFEQKEKDLQTRLADAQTRETELKNQIDTERATSGDLGEELTRERQRREQIQIDIERLRRENSLRPTPTEPQQHAPVIASIFLPNIGTRGGGTIKQNFSIERGTKRIAVRLALPDDAKAGERFSVALNEKNVAKDLAVLVSSGGQKAVQLTVSPNDLLDGANKLTVTNAAGAEVSQYVFNMQKR